MATPRMSNTAIPRDHQAVQKVDITVTAAETPASLQTPSFERLLAAR
jgi:hypothetical protein